MALALNNLQRVDMPLNKETKPNMLPKRIEKRLDGNDTRMLRAFSNKSWKQHSTKYQLYGYLPPISQIINKFLSATNTGWSLEDLPCARDDWDEEWVSQRAISVT